jgi:hypothetical protein
LKNMLKKYQPEGKTQKNLVPIFKDTSSRAWMPWYGCNPRKLLK